MCMILFDKASSSYLHILCGRPPSWLKGACLPRCSLCYPPHFLQSVMKGRDRIVHIPDITTNFNMYFELYISSSFWLECKYQHWQQKSPVYKICLSLFHIFELVNKKFPNFRLVCQHNFSNVLDLMFLSQTYWNNAPNVSHLEKFVFTNIDCAGWLNKTAKIHEICSDFKPNASNFLSYPSPNWNYTGSGW